MAIRILRKLKVVCNQCSKNVASFRAFVASEEEQMMNELTIICNDCEIGSIKGEEKVESEEL